MNLAIWIDGLNDGLTNMSIDESLAIEAGLQQNAILRFYGWSQATLSLGYFQKHLDRQQFAKLADLPFTRRLSGGGAILHHHELTYSLAMPVASQSKSAASEMYCQMHSAIQAAVGNLGYELQSAACKIGTERSLKRSEQQFMCFERRADIDLVLGNAKIVGSAQRRIGDVVLQHGSILLAASEFAPTLRGMLDGVVSSVPASLTSMGASQESSTGHEQIYLGLSSDAFSKRVETFRNDLAGEIVRALEPHLLGCLGLGRACTMIDDRMVVIVESRAADLQATKYATSGWLYQR